MKYLIFTGSNCNPCKSLKAWLDSHGVEFQEFDVEGRHYLAKQHNVRGDIPVSIKLNQGIEVGRMTGFNNKNFKEAKQFFGV